MDKVFLKETDIMQLQKIDFKINITEQDVEDDVVLELIVDWDDCNVKIKDRIVYSDNSQYMITKGKSQIWLNESTVIKVLKPIIIPKGTIWRE